MSKRPWYKRYAADFVHGTLGLTLEEKGAYSLCLDLIYDRRGPIPDDARWIAGVCGCSLRKWTVVRARLIATGKLFEMDTDDGPMLFNRRAEREINGEKREADLFTEAGREGGRKSAENRAKMDRISPENSSKSRETEPKRPPNVSEKDTGSSNSNNLPQAPLNHRAGARAGGQMPDARNQIPEREDTSPPSPTFDTEKASPLSDPKGGSDVGEGATQQRTGRGDPDEIPPFLDRRLKPPHAPDGFERFWKQAEATPYASKEKARKAWEKTKHVRPSDDEVIACHTAYRADVAAENERRRTAKPPRAGLSLCHPVTFIEERRWEGYLERVRQAPQREAEERARQSSADEQRRAAQQQSAQEERDKEAAEAERRQQRLNEFVETWGEPGRIIREEVGDPVTLMWFTACQHVDGKIIAPTAYHRQKVTVEFAGALAKAFPEGVEVECLPPAKAA